MRSNFSDEKKMVSHKVDPSEILAIIPARGGSKRINQKNLSIVAGKSLLEWTILAAKNAAQIKQILVSTDDEYIAQVAKNAGVSIPWMRPEELARDDSTSISVVLHEVKKWISEKGHLKIVLLLEPTTPLRQPGVIDSAIDLLLTSDADSVISVCQVPHQFNPEETLQIKNQKIIPYLPNRTMKTRRLGGEQKSAYIISGVVYAVKVEALLSNGSLFGQKVIPLETPWSEFVDIDYPTDIEKAEFVLNKYV